MGVTYTVRQYDGKRSCAIDNIGCFGVAVETAKSLMKDNPVSTAIIQIVGDVPYIVKTFVPDEKEIKKQQLRIAKLINEMELL